MTEASELPENLASPGGGADETIVDGESSAGRRHEPSRVGLRRGDAVARYVVLEEVGRGAMGVVYVAIDPDLERRVAVKVLHRGQARLLGEARALARLSHPNVVGVYDVGTSAGHPFIAMEYVDGISMDRWLSAQSRGWEQIVDVFISAGRGLAAAHAAGLIHRDFKPANVMVAGDGGVKVTDFGLAHAPETDSADDGSSEGAVEGALDGAGLDLGSPRSGSTELTATRGLVGTPAFMAPELHHGEPASARADQFSFCVALYQSLYGEHPFGGDSVVSVIAAVISDDLNEPPAGSPLPSRLRRVLLEGLRAAPSERHPSMDALVDELVALRAPSRRVWWAAVAAGVIGLGTWLALQPEPPDPCADAGAAVENAWTEARATELHAAFERSGLPFADRASEEAVGRLDAYAEQWRVLQDQSCRAQRSTDVAMARNAALTEHCLERARSDLLAVADVLVVGELRTVTHATELVYGLPQLDQCTDPTLASALPIPDDPQTRDEVAHVRARLSELRAQRVAGHEGEAATLAALTEEADVLGFAPLRAELSMERAFARLGSDQDDAVRLLELALQLAVEGDADLVAAVATAELLALDGDGRGDDRRAQAWEQLARGYLRRWPDRGRLQVKTQAALSRTLSQRGDYDEAVALALDAANRAEELDDPWRASIHRGNYGLVLTRAGRLDEALTTLSAHVEHTIELYGPEHPEAAWAYNALGNVYIQLADTDGAYRWCSKAAKVYRTLDDHPLERAHALNNLAATHSARDEPVLARDVALEAIESIRQHTDGDHPTLAALLNNLGSNANGRGKPEEAVTYFRDSLEMRKRLGEAPLQQLLPTANLAVVLLAAGDGEAARRQLEDTVALLERHVPDEYPMAGRVYQLVGRTYFELGDVPKAIEHLSTAERLLRTMLGPDAELTEQVVEDLVKVRASVEEQP